MIALSGSSGSSSPKARPTSVSYVAPSGALLSMTIFVTFARAAGAPAQITAATTKATGARSRARDWAFTGCVLPLRSTDEVRRRRCVGRPLPTPRQAAASRRSEGNVANYCGRLRGLCVPRFARGGLLPLAELLAVVVANEPEAGAARHLAASGHPAAHVELATPAARLGGCASSHPSAGILLQLAHQRADAVPKRTSELLDDPIDECLGHRSSIPPRSLYPIQDESPIPAQVPGDRPISMAWHNPSRLPPATYR